MWRGGAIDYGHAIVGWTKLYPRIGCHLHEEGRQERAASAKGNDKVSGGPFFFKGTDSPALGISRGQIDAMGPFFIQILGRQAKIILPLEKHAYISPKKPQ
jgi:hypothetical protein